MLRTIFYFLIIGALAAGGAWLADHPGNIVIHWFGYEGETSVGVLIVLLLLVLAIGFFGLSLLRNIFNSARLFSERQAARRRAKAAGELVKGFGAVAMGDALVARRSLRGASAAKELAGLARLLTAQVAELEHDPVAAEQAYRELLKDPATEFLALRGLYETAIGEGDRSAALAFASRAFEMKPRAPQVADQLFRIQTQAGAFELARKTIAAARRSGHLTNEVARRREGVLSACEALAADAAGERERAFSLAQRALALAPGLTLMATYVSREQSVRGQSWAASGTIETAWRIHPHPDLAATYDRLRPGDTPVQRARRLMGLAEFNPGHVESRLLVAREALAMGEVRRARRALRPVVDSGSARVLMMMSEIALKGGEGDAVAQAFRARAVVAPRDAQWTCRECGHESADWHPLCESCGAFDTAVWGSEGAVALTDLVEAPAEHEALDWRGELTDGAAAIEKPPAAVVVADVPAADSPIETDEDVEIFVPPRQPDDPGPEGPETVAGSAYN